MGAGRIIRYHKFKYSIIKKQIKIVFIVATNFPNTKLLSLKMARLHRVCALHLRRQQWLWQETHLIYSVSACKSARTIDRWEEGIYCWNVLAHSNQRVRLECTCFFSLLLSLDWCERIKVSFSVNWIIPEVYFLFSLHLVPSHSDAFYPAALLTWAVQFVAELRALNWFFWDL